MGNELQKWAREWLLGQWMEAINSGLELGLGNTEKLQARLAVVEAKLVMIQRELESLNKTKGKRKNGQQNND
jgi:hypothetical protein